MANIKISELISETELSDGHIFITEQEKATATKKSTLGLLFDWIVGKLPIATADKAGNIKSGGDITVDTNGAVTVNSVGGKTVNADVPENAVFTDTVSVNYTATLTANSWVGDTAPFTQAVEIVGMTSEVSPIIDIVTSDVVDTGKEEIKQWSYIAKAVSGDDTITFTCYDNKPTIDLNVKIKVV